MHSSLPQGLFWIVFIPRIFQEGGPSQLHTSWHETEAEALAISEETSEDDVVVCATQTRTENVPSLWAVFDLEGGVAGHRLVTLYPSLEAANEDRPEDPFEEGLSEPTLIYLLSGVPVA